MTTEQLSYWDTIKNKKLIFLAILGGLLFVLLVTGGTFKLYEYYDAGENGVLYANASWGQNFTIGNVGPNEDFILDSIQVYIKREGNPGMVDVELYKSHPSGALLSSGSFNASELTTSFAWISTNMTDYTLSAGEDYMFLYHVLGGDASNRLIIQINASGGYSGGIAVSWDGATLTTYPDYDTLFKIYGTGPLECSPILNEDWIISEAEVCDATQVTTGTGLVIITTGNLTLINSANVTCNGLNIFQSGEKIFVNQGSQFRIN